MISLTSEFTDCKSRHARGWLFFDADCRFCAKFARWIGPVLQNRGIELAPLQDPRVGALLGLTQAELLRALRLVLADGRQFVGGNTVLAVAREIKWARPLVWLSKIPGMTPLLGSAYLWLAAKRGCVGRSCVAWHRHTA